MSLNLVQNARAILPGAGGTISFPVPTTPNNLVLVGIAFVRVLDTAASFNFTLSDDSGLNNYTQLIGAHSVPPSNLVRAEADVFYPFNTITGLTDCASLQTLTIVGAFGGSPGTYPIVQVWMVEVSGVPVVPFATFDAYPNELAPLIFPDTGSPTTTDAIPAVLPPMSDPIWYGADPSLATFQFAVIAPEIPSASVVDSPFTLLPIQNGFACAYDIGTMADPPQAIFTNGSGSLYAGALLRLPAGSAPTTGRINVVKVTNPISSPQSFTFRPNWESVFSLSGGQSHLSSPLGVGTYSITEDAVPNWTTTTDIDPTAIVVTAGVTTTITFTNTFVPPVPPPGPVCYADGIIPTGAIDGINTSFTLPTAPNPPGSLILESDTSVLAPGVGFNLSFVLSGTQLTLTYPPKNSLVAWYRIICGAQQSIPPLYKLNPDQAFDDNAFTSTPTAINSTYFTYGFVNAAKAAQNPLLGFHRKRFSEIQMNVNGSGQFIVTAFPNYILKKDLSYNPYAYVVPPILLQTDPPDDLIRPLNSVGNRVYVKFETNAVGAAFDISKTILCGVIDAWATVNPNSG